MSGVPYEPTLAGAVYHEKHSNAHCPLGKADSESVAALLIHKTIPLLSRSYIALSTSQNLKCGCYSKYHTVRRSLVFTVR